MKWAKRLAAFIVVALLAFFAGRHSTPSQVVYENTVDTSEKVEVEQRQTVIEERIEETTERQTERSIARVRISVEKPDGTKVVVEKEGEIESQIEKTLTQTETDTKEVDIRIETEYVERVVEKKVVINSVPDWTLGLRAGARFGSEERSFFEPTWLVGGEINRRVLGPMQLGVWLDVSVAPSIKVDSVGIKATFPLSF